MPRPVTVARLHRWAAPRQDGDRAPTLAQAATFFGVPMKVIEGAVENYGGDKYLGKYLGIAVASRSGAKVRLFARRDRIIEAY